MIFQNDKTYDVLKWIAQILLPAAAVFWFAIAEIWDLPFSQEIQTTIIAFDTFLGAILGISNKKYNDSYDYSGIPDRDDNKGEC